VAIERWITGWQQRAEAALTSANYEAALNSYQQLGDQASINHVLTLQGKAQLAHLATTAGNHEKAERWAEAVEIYTQLLAKFPDDESWQKRLATAKEETELATIYAQALGLIQEKKMKSAPKLLAKVIGSRPDYKEIARYLLLALQGDDVTTLKEKLVAMTTQSANLQAQLVTVTQQVRTQQAQIASLEAELAQLCLPPTQAEAPKAAPELTQHLNAPAIELRLAIWNPLNYLRLLWWVWIQPKAFKQFRVSLDAVQTKRLEYLVVWTVSTLSWGALGGYAAWGVAHSSLLLENPLAVYTLSALLILAWFLTGRYGHLNDSDSVLAIAAAAAGAVVIVGAGAVAVAGAVSIAFGVAIVNAKTNAMANGISVAFAIASAFAFAFAFAVAVENVSANEIGLMTMAWVIFWLKAGEFSWPLSISAAIVAGVGCSSILFWVSGRLSASSLGQSAINLVMGIATLVIIFFIMAGIGTWLENRIKNT
jgi:tetratricopeptide (TPR) repeat protein